VTHTQCRFLQALGRARAATADSCHAPGLGAAVRAVVEAIEEKAGRSERAAVESASWVVGLRLIFGFSTLTIQATSVDLDGAQQVYDELEEVFAAARDVLFEAAE
jgi:hypothetical protein